MVSPSVFMRSAYSGHSVTSTMSASSAVASWAVEQHVTSRSGFSRRKRSIATGSCAFTRARVRSTSARYPAPEPRANRRCALLNARPRRPMVRPFKIFNSASSFSTTRSRCSRLTSRAAFTIVRLHAIFGVMRSPPAQRCLCRNTIRPSRCRPAGNADRCEHRVQCRVRSAGYPRRLSPPHARFR